MYGKVRTLIWFLKRPQYLTQIFQVFKRNKNVLNENSSEESLKWCKLNYISQGEALKNITGNSGITDIHEFYSEDFKWANKQEKNCPYKMGGEGAISFLYKIVINRKPEHVIETGVAYGWSSLSILLALESNKKGFLVSNDMPYIKMGNDDYVGCVIPERLKKRWRLQRSADVNGIPKALKYFNNKVDLIHYDSDKSYSGRMWSAPILWEALSENGLFVSDDINDNLGFKHFCEKVNREPVIVEHLGKYVGVLIK